MEVRLECIVVYLNVRDCFILGGSDIIFFMLRLRFLRGILVLCLWKYFVINFKGIEVEVLENIILIIKFFLKCFLLFVK